jgi:hypothetical protein
MLKLITSISTFLFYLTIFSQPVIPSSTVKIISYQGNIFDGSRLAAINAGEKASNGQIQNITKKQSEDGSALAAASNWNLIHKGSNIFLIQNSASKKYLGVNKKYPVPPPNWSAKNGDPFSVTRGWFVYENEITDSSFYWQITYHKQHKGGDVQYYKTTEPYDIKFQGEDVFNIINVVTHSRLSSVNVNGLMNGDYVQRLCVSGTPDCGSVTLERVDENGKVIEQKVYATASNNEWDSRWYISGARKTADPKAYKMLRGNCDAMAPAGGSGNNSSSNIPVNNNGVKPPPKPPGNGTPPSKPPVVVITPPTPQNNDAKDVLGNWRLTGTEITVINNKGQRKKIPSIMNGIVPKLELSFTNNGELTIRNPNNSNYSKYNWKYYGQDRLDLTPVYRNEGDEDYLGIVSFRGNTMTHTVITKENGQTRETVYTYSRF